jgi:GNAT superfamily N-acetyltransferase
LTSILRRNPVGGFPKRVEQVKIQFEMNRKISLAETDQEILDCYPVMAELREHLERNEFVATVKRLAEIAGYKLAYLIDGDIKAVAGFRISEWLAAGKYLDIDDLVATASERSKGYGGELFDWLVKYARHNDCDQVRLVSRVTRLDAHRFYLKKQMTLEAYYFSLQLK